MISKIISGGQTGADLGGLEAAFQVGFPYGGCVPKGRFNEAGVIDPKYVGLVESTHAGYLERTELNVRHSDCTLLFVPKRITPGSKKTRELCTFWGRPCVTLNWEELNGHQTEHVTRVLSMVGIKIANVAGSRESIVPGLQLAVERFLTPILQRLMPQKA